MKSVSFSCSVAEDYSELVCAAIHRRGVALWKRAVTIPAMQWLVHGTLTAAAGEALKRHGHSVHALEEAQLGPDSPAAEVLKSAQGRQWDLITNDASLAGAPFEQGLSFNRCIVYLQLEGGDVEQDDAIDRLFDRYKRLTPRRLYTVTTTRVKIRQLPGDP